MKNLFEEDAQSNLSGTSFSHLYNIVRSLRGPEGCPWDKEQTLLSLRSSLLEEANESIEAINSSDHSHIKEELGDVLLVLMLLSYIEEQDGNFTVAEMIESLSEKLVRRHPHVFGESAAETTEEVLIQWEKIKAINEKRGYDNSVLDSVPKHLPVMERSYKLQKKAAKNGFDWRDYQGVIEKIREELDEVEDALTRIDESGQTLEDTDADNRRHLEEELGDLLFAVINLGRKTGVHPNDALSRTNSKFYSRFSYIEQKMTEAQLSMTMENIDEMERFWLEAKNQERES